MLLCGAVWRVVCCSFCDWECLKCACAILCGLNMSACILCVIRCVKICGLSAVFCVFCVCLRFCVGVRVILLRARAVCVCSIVCCFVLLVCWCVWSVFGCFVCEVLCDVVWWVCLLCNVCVCLLCLSVFVCDARDYDVMLYNV